MGWGATGIDWHSQMEEREVQVASQCMPVVHVGGDKQVG